MSGTEVKDTLKADESSSEEVELSAAKESETKVEPTAMDISVSEVKDESKVKPDSGVKTDLEIKPVLDPKAQRKPRINRRSYIVDSKLVSTLSTEKSEKKEVKVKESLNGCDAGSGKKKVDPPARRIISLKSIKSSSASKPLIIRREKESSIPKEKDSSVPIKRSVKRPITYDLDKKEPVGNVVSSSPEAPPKKKHKPITWP